MAYSVLIPGAIAAKNIDSLNKNCVCASALENGNVVVLGALSATAQQNEVYSVSLPATSTLATATYLIVNEPVNVLTNSKYAGLTDDPREFNIAAAKVFNAFLPMVGDEVIISTDGLAGTKGENTYVIPANGTGELTWAVDASTTALGLKLIQTTYVTVGATRVVAYKFLVVKA